MQLSHYLQAAARARLRVEEMTLHFCLSAYVRLYANPARPLTKLARHCRSAFSVLEMQAGFSMLVSTLLATTRPVEIPDTYWSLMCVQEAGSVHRKNKVRTNIDQPAELHLTLLALDSNRRIS